jgi:hypothetical protein
MTFWTTTTRWFSISSWMKMTMPSWLANCKKRCMVEVEVAADLISEKEQEYLSQGLDRQIIKSMHS